MDRNSNRVENYVRFQVFKNATQPFLLFWIFCKQVNIKSFLFPIFQVLYQQIKAPVKGRLYPRI
jgi:hypothetical protein